MVLREPFNMRKISSNETQRRYARNYTGFPGRLISAGMEKKCLLCDVGKRISDVLGVHQSGKNGHP